MKLKISIIIILFFSFSSSFNLPPGTQITSSSELTSLLNKTDLPAIAFFYKTDSENSNLLSQMIQSLYPKYEDFIEIFLIDCEKANFTECSFTSNETSFAFFELFEPPLYRLNPYTKSLNQHSKRPFVGKEMSMKTLNSFIANGITDKSININKNNIDDFLRNNEMNKFILFTEKKNTPLLFKGLSNYFYDKIKFAVVKKSENEICEKFKVSKFPSLMIYQNVDNKNNNILDEAEIKFYEGEQNAKNIINFLKNYELKEKLYLNSEKNKAKISEIFLKNLNEKNYKDFFEKNNNNNIIIYFDNKKLPENNKNLDYYSLLPKDIQNFNSETHGFFKFGYLNCIENSILCNNEFKIKTFPSLILYQKNSKNRILNGNSLPLEFSEIESEINNLFPSEIKEANAATFNVLLSESYTKHKLPFLYFFEDKVQLSINLLSLDENIKKFFTIIVFYNPPQDIISQLQIKSFPSVFFAIQNLDNNNINGRINMMVFNDKISFSSLKNFITQNFRFRQNENENTNYKSNIQYEKQQIHFINSTNILTSTCNLKKLCMLIFMDLRNNETAQNQLKIIDDLAETAKNRPVSFGYLNATCQEELSSNFGIDLANLPKVILYSISKGVFVNFEGKLDSESLNEFISKTVRGLVTFNRIQKELVVVKDIKCEEIKMVQVKDDDDDIMKELLEEEKKKREMFDKERGIDDEDGKKKKKKRKKKKKVDDL